MEQGEQCATCGEPLSDDQLCGVCMFAEALETVGTGAAAPSNAVTGMIGRYRIVRLLGEGGMGAVYEAEQEQPHRTVALKVIKTGFVSAELLRRFARESEVLARLHHPGIAQVFEAGAAENGFGPQPYFAMEFIEGEPLDQYAEAHRLTTPERLRLMIEICDAVQHAHQRGIIHRDLKPANILVDRSGHPKILDFGVARVTDSDARATRQTDMGQLMGTLAYMSPEQVLADPFEIDTRSDIYTLGVILYELLAGRMPYHVTGHVHQAAQAIRDEDPAPLRSVNRSYRGDIETIVAKALEKEKMRRYASAADLASDLRRHLDDQPILACRATATYQMRKFARRHKALVAGLAGIFIALVAGIVASRIEANRARVAEQQALAAQRAALTAEQTATRDRDRALAAEARAKESSQRAAASEAGALQDRDRALRERQRADTEAATAKAVNEFLQGDLLAQASNGVQATPGTRPDPDLKIRTALDRAAARVDGKFADKPLVEASIRLTIGTSYHDLGLFQEAQRQLEKARDLRNRYLGAEHPDTLVTTSALAKLLIAEGKYGQAEEILNHALTVERRILGKQNRETLSTMYSLATAYRLLGKFDQAQPLYLETLELQTRRFGDEHPDTLSTMGELGNLYYKTGQYVKSAEVFEKVVEISRRVLGGEHPGTVSAMNDLANAYQGRGMLVDAERLYLSVREIQVRVRGEEHPNTLLTLSNLALLYRNEGKLRQSEEIYARLMEVAPRVFGKEHPRTLAVMDHLAALYRQEEKYAQAEQLWTTVLDARHRVLGAQHPDTTKVLAELGFVRIELKKYAEAEPLLRESLAAHEKSAGDSPALFNDQILLGQCLAGEGEYLKAEALLLAGYEGLVQREGGHIYLDKAGQWIVQLYQNWGKPDKAVDWARKVDRRKLAISPH
jgi:tetratricopeptide (TPR) repeat protein/predicted Ser/Thr protein kinase